MIAIVCGGRDYADRFHIFIALDRLHSEKVVDLLIEGGADGADSVAREWAKERGVQCVTIHANWTKHGKSAGPKRNKLMANTALILAQAGSLTAGLVAFPGGAGTRNMIETAENNGLSVWRPKA